MSHVGLNLMTRVFLHSQKFFQHDALECYPVSFDLSRPSCMLHAEIDTALRVRCGAETALVASLRAKQGDGFLYCAMVGGIGSVDICTIVGDADLMVVIDAHQVK